LGPVDLGKDFVGSDSVEVKLDELFPSVSEFNCGDASEHIFCEVELQEILHLLVTDEGVHECKNLESLFIWYLGERVVGVVTLENGMESGVCSINGVICVLLYITP
jgi:hypothetical protein